MKSVPLLVVFLNIFSIWSPSRGHSNFDNQPDSSTGLSPKEKRIVRETWALIKKDPLGSGQAVVLQFLKQYPSYQLQFSKFSHVPIENLPHDPNFQKLCVDIVDSLTDVIDSLDNPDVLVDMLRKLGEGHKKYGVTVQQYFELQYSMLDVLGVALGQKWTSEVRATWDSALDTINGIIITAYI